MHNTTVNSDQIEAFWDWFLTAEAGIRAYFSEEEGPGVDKNLLIEQINNRVLDFGHFAWEIGPGQDRDFHFLISPNGSAQLLEVSKEIMRAAPDLGRWEFYPARPPRPERLQFKLYDDYMLERNVDATNWRCVLLKKLDGTMQVLLEVNTITHLDNDTQQLAAQMLVTNLLGEELKINRIHKIDVVNELEMMHESMSFPVAELPKRVRGK